MAAFLRIRPQSIPGLLRLSFSPRVSFSRLKLFTAATSVPRSGQRLKSYSNGSERYHGNSRDFPDQNGSDGRRFSLLGSASKNGPQSPYVPHPIQKNHYYAIWSLFSKRKDGFLRYDPKADKLSFDGRFGPTHFNTIGFRPEQVSSDDAHRVPYHLFAGTNAEKKVILTRHPDTNDLVAELYNEDQHSNAQRCHFEAEYFWSYTLFKNMSNAWYIASDAAGNATLVRQMEGSRYPSPETLFILTGMHIETG